MESGASGSPITGKAGANGFGSIIQGSLETSNVDIVSEITNLISAQRAYEMNSKVIKTSRRNAADPRPDEELTGTRPMIRTRLATSLIALLSPRLTRASPPS